MINALIDIVKHAIYLQVLNVNANENSLDSFELEIAESTFNGLSINFLFEASTIYQSFSNKIETVLTENYNEIVEFISTQLMQYLGNSTNGYNDINSTALVIDLMDVSVIDTDTSITSNFLDSTEPSDENPRSHINGKDDPFNEISVYIIAGALLIVMCCIIFSCCYIKRLQKKDIALENKSNVELKHIHQIPSKETFENTNVNDTDVNSSENVNNNNNNDGNNNKNEMNKAKSEIGSDNDVVDGDGFDVEGFDVVGAMLVGFKVDRDLKLFLKFSRAKQDAVVSCSDCIIPPCTFATSVFKL